MKNEELSLQTKKMLAASLKHYMEKKPLAKITISEIAADCGVNRKTFYYHFADTHALLKWMLEQETVEIVKQFDLLTNPVDALNFVINYVEDNRHILNYAYDGMGLDELKRFFYQNSFDLVQNLINDSENELHLNVESSFKMFLADFFTEALAGILIGYFRNKTTIDRDEFVHNLVLTCKTSMTATLTEKAKNTNLSSRS